ncbi:MAG TPA: hypothetical protein VLT83_03820 [Opitutaceae bacterium]|nr:hypothetical protein [Opitutaceae bacterium]
MNALIINPLSNETSNDTNGATRELANYSHNFPSAHRDTAADSHSSLAGVPFGLESLVPGD